MESHYSWNKEHKEDILCNIFDFNIPEYSITDTCYEDMYDNFFNKFGCMIIKGVYSDNIMTEYDNWCGEIYDEIKDDKNINHAIQKDKILFNNIIERMGQTNPKLLYTLLGHHKLNNILDNLLGFAKIGSCTGHKVLKGGDRQETHVDYPIHLNSGSFWKDDGGVSKVKKIITRYQLNYVLPYFSLQSLTAVCDMDENNGSTEVIPCSHKIPDIDIKLRDQKYREEIEKYFINVNLKKGDVLIFNRRLCHRGGRNESDKDRNALITQYVWSWGLGQEYIKYESFFDYLNGADEFNKLSEEDKELFKLRFKFEYPLDVSERG